MAGLLSLTPTRRLSLLNLPYARPMADAADEAMFARSGGGYTPSGAPIPGAPPVPGAPGLLAAASPAPAPSGGLLAPAAPAPARRERVSGWRLLDRVLGGETITEGLDNERARLQAEADAPARAAQMAQLRSIAESMGPQALLAFATNQEAFGKEVAERFGSDVLASGSAMVTDGRISVDNPDYEVFGDQMVRTGAGGVAPVMTRGPTHAEQTARITANRPIELAPGAVAINPDGSEFARGAGRILSAPDGAELYREDGNLLASNQRDPAPTNPQDAAKARAGVDAMSRQAATVNDAVERAKGQVGFWTTGALSGLSAVGGTPAADLAATIDTIEANLSFQALAEMRANSPTGGALGSITERELSLLGATVASLRQSQSPTQLRANLDTISQSLTRLAEAQRAAFEQTYGGQSAQGGRPASGPIAEDANGNRVQWNGSEWAPL